MLACKAFEKGLKCRGYQFKLGLNVTDEANCRQNGFHCAENPLDCLSYYSDIDNTVFCIVDAGGDIDEDSDDSKISCTELNILKELSVREFFLFALAYMCDHPKRNNSCHVSIDKGVAHNGYTVVRGVDPLARGRLGDYLALAKENTTNDKIEEIALVCVDGVNILPDTWYDVELHERGTENE